MSFFLICAYWLHVHLTKNPLSWTSNILNTRVSQPLHSDVSNVGKRCPEPSEQVLVIYPMNQFVQMLNKNGAKKQLCCTHVSPGYSPLPPAVWNSAFYVTLSSRTRTMIWLGPSRPTRGEAYRLFLSLAVIQAYQSEFPQVANLLDCLILFIKLKAIN